MKLNLKSKKILIVEDYSIMRNALKEMLYAIGAQDIFEVINGQDAITAMHNNKFDIILCDYNLGPGKNGQQVLEEAKYNKLLPYNVIFIIVTVEHDLAMVLGAVENKPDEYLTKPFTAQQLLSRLAKNYNRKNFLGSVEREMHRGNFAIAVRNCDKLLKSSPTNMRPHLLKLRAQLSIAVGDLNTAKAIYQEVLQQRELNWARNGLGKIFFLEGNYEQAIKTFHQVINDHPMLMEAYDWLAKSLIQTARYKEAEDILHTAIELSPQAILRQKDLGEIADQNNNLEAAERAYQAVVTLGKNSVHKLPSDFSKLAKLYSKTNKEIVALKIIDDMRQTFPNNTETELTAATLETRIYQKLDNKSLTVQAYNRLHQYSNHLNHQLPKELQMDIVAVFYSNDDTEKADQLLQALVRKNIDDESFLNKLMELHKTHASGYYAEHIIQQTRQELIEINNNGVRLYKQEKFSEALEIFAKAIKKMPDNKTIIVNMAKVILYDMKKTGCTQAKLAQAKAYINKALQIGVSYNKISNMQTEYAKLFHAYRSS
jgi:tetratricopeptide (TPR) repeat protein